MGGREGDLNESGWKRTLRWRPMASLKAVVEAAMSLSGRDMIVVGGDRTIGTRI